MQNPFPYPGEQEYASYNGRFISLHQTGDILVIPFLLAGYELHHLRILRERYLPTLRA